MQDNSELTPKITVERAAETAPKSGRRKLIALIAGAAVVAGGAFGAHAIAQTKTYQHVRQAAFDGGWHGREHKPLAEMSEAEIESHVTRMVRHLSIEIDATPEQEAKIIEVATGAVQELRPLKDRMKATGMELEHLLSADAIDREALEALRASRLAEMDRISKTLVAAIADVAEVLSPEQRETLQRMIRERRGRHHGWGRHGRQG